MLSDIQYSLLLKIIYARKHEVEKSVIMTVAGAANCKMDYNMMEKKGMRICVRYLKRQEKRE